MNAPQPPHDESGHGGQQHLQPHHQDSATPPTFGPGSSPPVGLPTTTDNPDRTQVISAALRSEAAKPDSETTSVVRRGQGPAAQQPQPKLGQAADTGQQPMALDATQIMAPVQALPPVDATQLVPPRQGPPTPMYTPPPSQAYGPPQGNPPGSLPQPPGTPPGGLIQPPGTPPGGWPSGLPQPAGAPPGTPPGGWPSGLPQPAGAPPGTPPGGWPGPAGQQFPGVHGQQPGGWPGAPQQQGQQQGSQQQQGPQQQQWGQQQWGQPQWGAQPGSGPQGTGGGKALLWVLAGAIALVVIVGVIMLVYLR